MEEARKERGNTMSNDKKLGDKQERFCKEYVIDNNATQAAIRVGYSKNSAESQGSRLLTNAKVKARIAELQSDISEITKIDAAYVRERHVAIDQMDFIDILEDDGSLKPIRDWPKIFRQYLNGFEIAELWEGRGDEKEQIGVLKKIKWPDKMKNLELLGKHVDVQAYRERVEQSGELDINVSDKTKRRKRIEELLSKK